MDNVDNVYNIIIINRENEGDKFYMEIINPEISNDDSKKFQRTIVRHNDLVLSKFNLTMIQYKTLLYSIHKMELANKGVDLKKNSAEVTNKAYISIDEFRNEIIDKKNKDYKNIIVETVEAGSIKL